MTKRGGSRIRVAGEPVTALLPALVALVDSMVIDGEGLGQINAVLSAEASAPLQRALLRVEAELMQRDARVWDELARSRTPGNRSADALLVLVERVARSIERLDDSRRAAS